MQWTISQYVLSHSFSFSFPQCYMCSPSSGSIYYFIIEIGGILGNTISEQTGVNQYDAKYPSSRFSLSFVLFIFFLLFYYFNNFDDVNISIQWGFHFLLSSQRTWSGMTLCVSSSCWRLIFLFFLLYYISD